MADIMLATKIHIPPLHSNLVNRTRLIQRLNEGVVKSRLTIISAPAGYGKSTLLGEWVSQLDISVAWLSLERGENVPARFWKYFITALNEIPQVCLTGDELVKIGSAEKLEIAPLRKDGTLRKPVIIWVVRVGDDLYIRS